MVNIKQNYAFTLVELLIVIVIIAVLISLATASLMGVRKQARNQTRLVHIGQMQSALAAYHRDTGSYPTKITPGMAFLLGNITYMKQVPNNPLPVEAPCTSVPEYDYPVSDGISYRINFCLSTEINDIYGIATATPSGIQ